MKKPTYKEKIEAIFKKYPHLLNLHQVLESVTSKPMLGLSEEMVKAATSWGQAAAALGQTFGVMVERHVAIPTPNGIYHFFPPPKKLPDPTLKPWCIEEWKDAKYTISAEGMLIAKQMMDYNGFPPDECNERPAVSEALAYAKIYQQAKQDLAFFDAYLKERSNSDAKSACLLYPFIVRFIPSSHEQGEPHAQEDTPRTGDDSGSGR